MFDDFDLYETCEEFYADDAEWEAEDSYLDSYWEDQTDLECGFNPYMGCYDWDC